MVSIQGTGRTRAGIPPMLPLPHTLVTCFSAQTYWADHLHPHATYDGQFYFISKSSSLTASDTSAFGSFIKIKLGYCNLR